MKGAAVVKVALFCERCGASPGEGSPARAGGSHYIERKRVSGIGQKPFTRVTLCGRWTAEAQPPPRAAYVEAAEVPAQPFQWDCSRDGHVFCGGRCSRCGCPASSDPANARELREIEEAYRATGAAAVGLVALLGVAAIYALSVARWVAP